jgi:AraC-like DNA-binding protein
MSWSADRERVRYKTLDDGVELLEAAFDRHVYDRHMHESCAIGFTLRGVQRFWCRGATHDSTPGDVILIGPGEVHDGRSGAPGGYAYRMMYVSVDRLTRAIGDAVGRQACGVDARVPVRTDPPLARQLNAMWRAVDRSAGSLAAEELFDEALIALAARNRPEGIRKHVAVDARAVTRVRDYLHAHLEPVGVVDLAAIASMSRFQLTRQFQQMFGLPLHAYHLRVRLQEARRRLSADEAVASVATGLGFTDQSHLHRRFKETFGLTPGAWRRLSRG